MTQDPLHRAYIGSNEYLSTRHTPKPILALVGILAATSTRHHEYSFPTSNTREYTACTQVCFNGRFQVETINFFNGFPQNKLLGFYIYIWCCGNQLKKLIVLGLKKSIETDLCACSGIEYTRSIP